MLTPDRQFTAYGLSHWVVLVVFAVVALLLVRVGRGHADAAEARRFSRTFAVVILVLYLAIWLYSLVPPSLDRSMPLHLSDLASLVSAYALWTHRHWAFSLTYFWCLTLSVQALLSPVLTGPDFPHIGFLAFWGIHLLVIWAAIYLTWGLRLRPDWRSYRIAVAATVTWAVVTFTFNSFAGTNYGFLNRKPDTPSLLDVLGPWPWYLLPVAALVLGAWALMTWPWTRSAKHRVTGSPPTR
ncbi:TIGR02206 family membrane protein [Haloechinothrix sp. LS1_15]|nr:TIGR02206 family membrane protein [Haloechinothrix sp. LS1_15]